MANNTQIKIRYGLILQAVLAQALRNAGYSFAETPNYDANSEVPDFLIPDAENPKFMVEVHQTDARDHFRMKTLRSLTAVAEAKAFFGANVVSVNVLFGNPDKELPAANLQAMCGIFDLNIILRSDASDAGKQVIEAMENAALKLAGNTDVTTADAAREVVASHSAAVSEFQRVLTEALDHGAVKESLRPMWVAESARRAALGEPPVPGAPTYYKKNMVRSLFFHDEHFATMAADPAPNTWDQAIVRQVVATGIGKVTEEIDGDHLDVDSEFLAFLRDPDAPRLRGLCKEVLDATPSMHWFFEDIRDESRRRRMGLEFLSYATTNRMLELLKQNLTLENVAGIEHTRAWVVDAATRALGISQNTLSRLVFTIGVNPGKLGDPVSHIAPKTARFRGLSTDSAILYASDLHSCIEQLRGELGISWGDVAVDTIADRFMSLRILGAMRLRQLDALPLMVNSVASTLGLTFDAARKTSILSDLANEPSVGAFEFYSVSGGDQKTLVHAIAAEGNPRDKAKEWGARRFATLYRAPDGIAVPGESNNAVFVIDGTWNQSDVTRLYRCGWSRVIRLGQLDMTLREIFGLQENVAQRPSRRAIRLDAVDLSDLPMAAED